MSTVTADRWSEAHPRRRKRIWVQHVAVETDKLQMRVDAARARGNLTEPQEVVADGVVHFIDKARLAAFRDDPVPRRFPNWWRGTVVEAAYRHMHTARASMLDLYDDNELLAEIPLVVARANATLHRDDPRRLTVRELLADPPPVRRARMRRLVGDSYEQLDLEHAQLRSFRNILLSAAAFLTLIVVATLYFVWNNPTLMPLCFDGEIPACPTSEGAAAAPDGGDIVVVAVLGALGGALAATLSIRNLKGTSTPYDVPVALAALKVPMGALTAILGLVAIQGEFIPGLSELDSQGMILAYALVFGFAQQALSRLLDKQAQSLLEGLPGGKAVEPTPNSKEGLNANGFGAGPGAAPAGGSPGAYAPADAHPASPSTATATQGPVVVVDDLIDEGAGDDAMGDDTGPDEIPAYGPGADRPVVEPASATQQDQFDLLQDTGNDRREMTEEEEAALLEGEFGPADDEGIYGRPPATDDPPPSGGRPTSAAQ